MMRRRTLLKSAMAFSAGYPWLASGSTASRTAGVLWDYIIVGAGTAGLPAAIFASRRGAKVLLVDAADDIGGTLHLAMGQIAASGTHLQQARGIVDSPDAHYEDVMRLTRGLADKNIVRTTVDHAPRTVNWLLENGLNPLPDHPVTGESIGRDGYSVRRYLWGKNEGRDILAVVRRQLAPELASGRVAAQLRTRVAGLLVNDAGAVKGVRAMSEDGEKTFLGKHVLLTSGGYAMNPELFEMLVGFPAYTANAYPHSMGDGLRLAVSVGGWLRGQNLHRAGTGSILSSDQFGAKAFARFETRPQVRPPWEIWVNSEGRRFIREDEPRVYRRAQALLKQRHLRYAIVFDQAVFEDAPVGIPDWSMDEMARHFGHHPMFAKAQTLEELAKRARVDPAGLVHTVAEYNQLVKSGGDPLGREHMPRPIARPPYYAITHLGSSATSSTGVAVDESLRVLRGSGEPIPNLYAAGEVLGSGATLGNAFTPGMMLTPALTLGRLLGERLPLGRRPRT